VTAGKKTKLQLTRKRDLDATVTLRIDERTVRAIDLIARKQNRSRSNVIRLALEEALREIP